MINKKILTLISLLLGLFLLVGCFLGKPNQLPVITTETLPDATVGEEYITTIEATDADGDPLTYGVVGPEDMVIDETGIISGWIPDVAEDVAITVTVTDGITDPVSAPFTITVNEPVSEPDLVLCGITVLPETMTLMTGESGTIKSVTATYEIKGYDIPIALEKCTYTSDDKTVATVSNGVVTAVAEGTATITVTYQGKTDKVAVTVNKFELKLVGIEVDPDEMTLIGIGDEEDFDVTANYNDGTDEDVTSACTYGVSTVGVVREGLLSTGKVIAKGVGTTTISISYLEGDITKGTTLDVIVEGTIKIRWLEAAMRYNAEGLLLKSWINDPHNPATLILTGGEYHFDEVNDFYNTILPDIEGSVVIDGEGQLFADTTYTSLVSDLPIKERIEGEVEIIIYDTAVGDIDGTMVGNYTQWGYAYGGKTIVLGSYPNSVLAPEQGEGWWFIGYTDYFAHGEEILIL